MSIPNPRSLWKYGGSSKDLELDKTSSHKQPILKAGYALRKLSYDSLVIVMPGGGPPNDFLKAVHKNYPEWSQTNHALQTLRETSKLTLLSNAKLLASIWEAKLIDSENGAAAEMILQMKEKKGLFIIPYAPDSIVENNIRLDFMKSDTLTLAIADLLDVRTVVFLKDTDGIFQYDWRLSPSPEYYERITVREILSNVSRVGADGADDHLIEREAILRVSKSAL